MLSRESWIRLDGVELARGGRPVLRGITANLSGRAIGLVGANGAGKSTLIGAMLGVLKPRAGSIHIADLAVPERAMEVRTRSGVMAEQAGVFPGGSGVDAVAFAGILSGLPKQESLRRAHRVLDALEVGEERYRPSKSFSTGMRQRCKLAMSLVHDPDILILDEPTVGLDPPGRTQLLRIIRDLRDDGRRILLSTHLMQDAEFVCDDLLLLEAGQVAYSGPVRGLVDDGIGLMMASGDGMNGRFAAALEAAGYQIEERGANRVAFVPTGDGELRQFWKVAAESNIEVRTLSRGVASLEDAVVHAMEEARER